MAPDSPNVDIPPAGVRPDSGQTAQKPSLGRIVLYRHELYEDQDGCAPAIITAVNTDGTVALTVFFKNQAPYTFANVTEGEEEGQWTWPPKV